MAYSQRFHDIAALFDEAEEDETEITTAVGSSILGVSRELSSYLGGNSSAVTAIAKAAAVAAAGVSTATTRVTTTPITTSSSSARRIIPSSELNKQQQQQQNQTEYEYEYESFSSAHNKYATEQQQQQQQQQQRRQEEGDSESESSDDLSTEAEPGRQYYSPHRQRQSFVTMIRMQKQFNEKSRREREQQQQQRHIDENEQQPNDLVVKTTASTESCPLSPTLSPPKQLEREPQQPNELVLNNTDSTDSCTLSLNNSGDDIRSPSSATMNGNLSYELPSPVRSWQPQQQPQPQRQYHQPQQKTFLASPLLQERKKTGCSTPETAPTTPSSASPKPKEQQLPNNTRSWKARQFRRTFRHRASIARRAPTASDITSSSTIGIRPRSPSMIIPSIMSTPSNDSSSSFSMEYPQPQQQQQPQQLSPQQQEIPTDSSTRWKSKANESSPPVPQPLSPQRMTPIGGTGNVFRQSCRRNNTTNNNNAHTGASLLDTCTETDDGSPSLLSSRPGDRSNNNIKTTSTYDIPSIEFSPVRNLRSIFEKKKEDEKVEVEDHHEKKNRHRLLLPPSRFRSYAPTRDGAMRNVNVNNNVAKEELIIETTSSVVDDVVDNVVENNNNNNNTLTVSSSFTSYSSSSSPTSLPQNATLSPVRSLRSVFEKKNDYQQCEPPKQPVELPPPSQETEEKGTVVATTAVVATLASKEEDRQDENLHLDQEAPSSSSSSLVSSSIQNLRNTLDRNQIQRNDPDPASTCKKKKNRLNHHIRRQQKRQVVAYPNPKSPTRTIETMPLSQAEDSENNDCNFTTNDVVEEVRVAPQEQHRSIRASPLSPSSSLDENSDDNDCDHQDGTEVVEGAAAALQEQHPLVAASPLSPSSSEDNDDNDDDNYHDANEDVDGAVPSQEQQQLVIASPLSPSLSSSSPAPAPPPVVQSPPPPAEEEEPTLWWSEMENRVDRYHRSFTASKELSSLVSSPDNDTNDLGIVGSRRAYEEFAEHQNQLGKVMAVALYKGIAITKDKYELGIEMMKQHHKQELQDLQDCHQRQMTELKLNNNNNRAHSVALSGHSPHHHKHRNDVFRQRYKNRMNHNDVDYDDTRSAVVYGTVTKTNNIPGIDAATEVASTVYSNMSCRELSMDRYRLKLIQQMKRGKKKQQSQSVANVSVSGGGDGMNDLAAERMAINVATAAATIDNDDEDQTNKKDKAGDSDNETNNNAEEIQRLLDELQHAEQRQKLLEKQLQQAGVVLAEDIPYQLAKEKVASISARMNEIGSSNVTHEDLQIQKQLRQEYFRLEKDMAKYMTALSLTDEYVEEQQRIEEEWESSNYQENKLALCAIRSYMPVNIRRMTNAELAIATATAATEAGGGAPQQGLSPDMIKKFRRTNVLQLLRVDPAVISKWHPSTLEAYRVTGLSVTERRALHHHLLPVGKLWNDHSTNIGGGGGDPMNNRKLSWYQTMRINFKEALNQYERHIQNTSTTGGGLGLNHHQCNLLGKQCPVRANLAIDYFSTSDDATVGLGFPIDDIFEDPVTVVSSHDDRKLHEKTPAEVIAEARGVGVGAGAGADAVDQQRPPTTTRTTTTAVLEKQKHPHNQLGGPVILPTTTPLKKKNRMPSPALSSVSSIRPPKRNNNKMMMNTNSSSSFLAAVDKQQNPFLAAIAARRID